MNQTEDSLLASSEAKVSCLDLPVGEDVPLCLASDESTTHVLAVEVQAGRTRSLGTLRGRVWPTTVASGPVLIGSWSGVPVLIQLDQRRLLRLRLPDTCGASEAAYGPDLVALVTAGAERSTVTLYRLGSSPEIRDPSPSDTGPAGRPNGRGICLRGGASKRAL